MRWAPGLFLAAMVTLTPALARADAIDVDVKHLRTSADYKLRLSSALNLSRVRDARATDAMAWALEQDDQVTIRRVAALSLEMFDGLRAAGLHEYGPSERDLLWAGCVLHDIGTAIDYDDHHRHSHYLIMNAGLPGFAPRELMLISLIARYHRKGEPDASDLGDLAHPGDEKRLRLLSAIIRLAEQFERSRDGTVRQVHVEAREGGVALAAEVDPDRDPSVPIWAARRNADLLSAALGREVEIA